MRSRTGGQRCLILTVDELQGKKKDRALLGPHKLWEGTSPFTALKQPLPSPKRRCSVSPRLPHGPGGIAPSALTLLPPLSRRPLRDHPPPPELQISAATAPPQPGLPWSCGAVHAGTYSSRRPPLRSAVKRCYRTL